MAGNSSIMHDNVKHIYHSIPMDAPGAITMTERSRFCGSSKKVMTLILSSALLWIIVLDIMLVVYKSHHLNTTDHTDSLGSHTSTNILIAGKRAVIAPVGDTANKKSTSLPPGVKQLSVVHPEGAVTEDAVEGSKHNSGRDSAHEPLPNWFAHLHHHPEPNADSLHYPGPIHPTDQPTATPSSIWLQKGTMHHAVIPFPFHGVIPPPPPPFLSLPRPQRFHDPEHLSRMRKPWVSGRGPWDRDHGGRRGHGPWESDEAPRPHLIGPMGPPVEMMEPFPKPWIDLDGNDEKNLHDQEKPPEAPALSSHHGEMPEPSFFTRLITSIFGGPWNLTTGEDHHLPHGSEPHPPGFLKLVNGSEADDDDDDDSEDAIIDIDIST